MSLRALCVVAAGSYPADDLDVDLPSLWADRPMSAETAAAVRRAEALERANERRDGFLAIEAML